MIEWIFFLVWTILIFGIMSKKWMVIFVGGFLSSMLGITILINPMENINLILNRSLGWIHVLFGFYSLIKLALDKINGEDDWLDNKIIAWIIKLKEKNDGHRSRKH